MRTAPSRRAALGALGALGVLLLAAPALAGSYLNRAALLLAQGDDELQFLRRNLDDTELAALIHQLAERRLEAARDMYVPKEVVAAHPHLMLALEAWERAAAAAVERSASRFLERLRVGRDEAAMFRSLLERDGWKLPDP